MQRVGSCHAPLNAAFYCSYTHTHNYINKATCLTLNFRRIRFAEKWVFITEKNRDLWNITKPTYSKK